MKNTVKNKVKHAERSFNRYIIRFISLDTDIPFEDAVLASEDAHAPSVFEIIEEIRQTLSADEWTCFARSLLKKSHIKMQQQNSGSRFGLAKSGYSGFERSCVKILRIIFIKKDVRFLILREYIIEGVQAMANHDEKNKYAYLDQLSTEELRQLLCADIDSPVNGDEEAIFYILEVIESREQAHPSSPFPDLGKSWKEFNELYNTPEAADISLYPIENDAAPVLNSICKKINP